MSGGRYAKRHSVSVSDFLEHGKSRLDLELVAGSAGLSHRISEAAINRAGLALSGFFEHFAPRRIQVIGLMEHAYLSAMESDERTKRLSDFFQAKIPCVVITRHKGVFPAARRLAEQNKVPLLRSNMLTKHFINAATITMENLMAPRMVMQGTMVEIMGVGVLIEGAPGVGKSETALALIQKGHALVSDDVVSLRVDSAGSLIGAPSRATRYHMEIRGLGIVHVPSLFGVASVRGEKKLELIVTLGKPGKDDEKDRSGAQATREVLGVKVPSIKVPVAAGRDMTNLLETAALDQKLRKLGHDAAKELDERLVEMMTDGGNVSE